MLYLIYFAAGVTPIMAAGVMVRRYYIGMVMVKPGETAAAALERRHAQHTAGPAEGGALWLGLCTALDELTELARAHSERAALELELRFFLERFPVLGFALRGACFSQLALDAGSVMQIHVLQDELRGGTLHATCEPAAVVHLEGRCYRCRALGHYARACGDPGAARVEQDRAHRFEHGPAEFRHPGGPYWDGPRERWRLWAPPLRAGRAGRWHYAQVKGPPWLVLVRGCVADTCHTRAAAVESALAILLSVDECTATRLATRPYTWQPRD